MAFPSCGPKPQKLSVEDEIWYVVGAGNLVGDQWAAHGMSNGTERASNIAWLDGFFSGLILAQRHRYFGSDEDLDLAVEWMDQRLAANPDEKVSHAAAQLAAQLLARRDPILGEQQPTSASHPISDLGCQFAGNDRKRPISDNPIYAEPLAISRLAAAAAIKMRSTIALNSSLPIGSSES